MFIYFNLVYFKLLMIKNYIFDTRGLLEISKETNCCSSKLKIQLRQAWLCIIIRKYVFNYNLKAIISNCNLDNDFDFIF